jgi:hypothetical protein
MKGFEPRCHKVDGDSVSIAEFKGVEVLVLRNIGVNSIVIVKCLPYNTHEPETYA